jgi:carbamoyl-phosphate synthase large subunit
VYKLVDTCAAEFEAVTPYYYSTFDEENESRFPTAKKLSSLVPAPTASGRALSLTTAVSTGYWPPKKKDFETIMINCNPETVSTDFNIADKLYFEPVFWEHIYDIIEHEKPEGVVVQLGGQTALKLSEKAESLRHPHSGDQL